MENDGSHEDGSSGGQRQTFRPCDERWDTEEASKLQSETPINKYLLITKLLEFYYQIFSVHFPSSQQNTQN